MKVKLTLFLTLPDDYGKGEDKGEPYDDGIEATLMETLEFKFPLCAQGEFDMSNPIHQDSDIKVNSYKIEKLEQSVEVK